MTRHTYQLSRKSADKLTRLHPDLRRVIERAIQLTATDFTVLETLRSPQRQSRLISEGKSKTSNSRHLGRVPAHRPELGAVAHAADLGALLNNRLSWDWPGYFQIADAVRQASLELNIPVVWGGCWQKLSANQTAEQAHRGYLARKKSSGQPAFADGPHFELNWRDYPV